jgi:hypothetical protein
LIPSIHAAQALLEGGFKVFFLARRSEISFFDDQIRDRGGRCFPVDETRQKAPPTSSASMRRPRAVSIRSKPGRSAFWNGIDAILADSHLHEVHSFAISRGMPLAVLFQSTFLPMSSAFLGAPEGPLRPALCSTSRIRSSFTSWRSSSRSSASTAQALQQHALLLDTSFVGLEQPSYLPPAVALLSPLLPRPPGQLDDMELNDFLADHAAVVIVSLGVFCHFIKNKCPFCSRDAGS